jgi:hypothetical protein
MIDGDIKHPRSGVTNLSLTPAHNRMNTTSSMSLFRMKLSKQDFPAIVWLEWHRFKTPVMVCIVFRSTSLQIPV